jgi:hypothetical protein
MQRARGSQEAGRSRAILKRRHREITGGIHREITEFKEGSLLFTGRSGVQGGSL